MSHIIFTTTYNRLGLVSRFVENIKETQPDTPLFIVDDGSDEDTKEYLYGLQEDGTVTCVISNSINLGIAPSINIALDTIYHWVRFQQTEHQFEPGDPWISYAQDDTEFTQKNWFDKLIKAYHASAHYTPHSSNGITFITGHDAPEHQGSSIGGFKDSNFDCDFRSDIRATHMMALQHHWREMLPIDTHAEDGDLRGHPSEGRGSDVDWWFLRTCPNSPAKQGRTNLVVRGLCRHVGFAQRTSKGEPTKEVL